MYSYFSANAVSCAAWKCIGQIIRLFTSQEYCYNYFFVDRVTKINTFCDIELQNSKKYGRDSLLLVAITNGVKILQITASKSCNNYSNQL